MSDRAYTVVIRYKRSQDDGVIYELTLKGVDALEIINVINFISDHVEVLRGINIMPESGVRQ